MLKIKETLNASFLEATFCKRTKFMTSTKCSFCIRGHSVFVGVGYGKNIYSSG